MRTRCKALKRFWNTVSPAWVVRRTIWPYKPGWGTFNRRTNTLLDSGLTKKRAEELCAILNKRGRQ